MTVNDLHAGEYNPYYETYLKKTNDVTLIEGLQNNMDAILSFLKSIPEGKLNFQYEIGKWTIKEMLLHIIDTERIFAYRALRIAREDKTFLPGFDQDAYVLPSKANSRSMQSLLDEYKTVRLSSIALFDSFDDKMLLQKGTASDSPISVRAIGFILIGHENHHCEIIKKRYL